MPLRGTVDRARKVSLSPMSTTACSTAHPADRSRDVARSSANASTSVSTTCAPFSAITSAKARPSPLAAPVTKATWPSMSNNCCRFTVPPCVWRVPASSMRPPPRFANRGTTPV